MVGRRAKGAERNSAQESAVSMTVGSDSRRTCDQLISHCHRGCQGRSPALRLLVDAWLFLTALAQRAIFAVDGLG